MRLLSCGPNALTQFIDVLIETSQRIMWIWFLTLPKNNELSHDDLSVFFFVKKDDNFKKSCPKQI